MFRKSLMVLATMGLLLATGHMAPAAEAHPHHHYCETHHCKNGWHKHHRHHKPWKHYHSHRKFRHDLDFNHHPEYGWGYYNDPASNWVRAGRYHYHGYHCHTKKRWRHGHLVRVKRCHGTTH